MLAIDGFVPIALTSPRAALDLLESQTRVDLLVTDVVMPEMHGTMLVRLAQELRPGLPVLLISGYHAPAEADTAALQAHAFLTMPLSGEELVQAVRQLLVQPRGSEPELDSPAREAKLRRPQKP